MKPDTACYDYLLAQTITGTSSTSNALYYGVGGIVARYTVTYVNHRKSFFFSFTAIVFVNKLLYSSEKSVCLNISTELLRQVCSVAAAAVIRTKQARRKDANPATQFIELLQSRV